MTGSGIILTAIMSNVDANFSIVVIIDSDSQFDAITTENGFLNVLWKYPTFQERSNFSAVIGQFKKLIKIITVRVTKAMHIGAILHQY